jgi:hypothetical protein
MNIVTLGRAATEEERPKEKPFLCFNAQKGFLVFLLSVQILLAFLQGKASKS